MSWSSQTATRRPFSALGGAGSLYCRPRALSRSAPTVSFSASARSPALRASGPIDRQVGLGAGPRRQAVAALGHDAPGGLVAVDAAVGSRVANAAADVAAVLERAQPRSHHGRAAAGRSARPARQVPGVVGGAVDRVVGLEVGQVQRHVALAEDHRASRLEPVDHQRVRRGGVRLARQVAPGGGLAGQVEGFLHRHRQAVQRAPELAFGQRAVGGTRTLECGLAVVDHQCIQRRIEAVDAFEIGLEQLDTAHLAFAQRDRHRAGRAEGEGLQCGAHRVTCGSSG